LRNFLCRTQNLQNEVLSLVQARVSRGWSDGTVEVSTRNAVYRERARQSGSRQTFKTPTWSLFLLRNFYAGRRTYKTKFFIFHKFFLGFSNFLYSEYLQQL